MTVRGWLLALAGEIVVFGVVAVLVLDMRTHAHLEQVAGVNVRGYRGPLRPRPAPKERRLLLVGDSTAFAYGVAFPESFAEYLARRLAVERSRNEADRLVTIVNAASIGDGAHAMQFAIRDLAHVDPDIVVIDAGYDALCDGCGGSRRVARRESAVFRATGYMPILPLALEEKSDVLGRSDSARRRLEAGILHAAGRAAYAIDRVGSADSLDRGDEPEPACASPWQSYCGAIRAAVATGLDVAKGVVVLTPPYLSARHREQQRQMAGMLAHRFAGNSRVVYLDAGDAVDLRESATTVDGVHLSAAGNQAFAERLVTPMLQIVDRW